MKPQQVRRPLNRERMSALRDRMRTLHRQEQKTEHGHWPRTDEIFQRAAQGNGVTMLDMSRIWVTEGNNPACGTRGCAIGVIVEVSTPAHGTAAVVESEILYMPEPGYYGSDTFSYTVAGRSGMTGRAAVAVNVLSTNEPHVVEAGTPALGGEPMTVPRLAAGIAYEDAPVAVDRGLDASAERETRPAGNGRRSPLRRVRMHNRH